MDTKTKIIAFFLAISVAFNTYLTYQIRDDVDFIKTKVWIDYKMYARGQKDYMQGYVRVFETFGEYYFITDDDYYKMDTTKL